MKNLAYVLVLACALLALPASRAHAGSCPVCATDGDCAAADFCVVHDSDVGCGTSLSLCCPGQGCDTFTGRPSCETAGTCAVMCGSGDDCASGGAGGTCEVSPTSVASWCQFDDGTCASGRRWGTSAGDGLADTCVSGLLGDPDAAPGAPDAAPGTPDAGAGDGGGDDGCGCRAGGNDRDRPAASAGLALAGMALLVRLRRRR